jgi:hypothetical protein
VVLLFLSHNKLDRDIGEKEEHDAAYLDKCHPVIVHQVKITVGQGEPFGMNTITKVSCHQKDNKPQYQ